jgi:hypothetical protein
LARAIFLRHPVHRLLRHVYWSSELNVTGGAQENAVAEFAASVHGGPFVDLRDVGLRQNLERHERQHATDDDALHHVIDDGPSDDERGQSGACRRGA